MNKVIVIVGMGGGISYAVALKFGQAGYHVAMISRNHEKLKTYQEMLADDAIQSSYYAADSGNQQELTKAFKLIKEAVGNPEVLFYNAAKMKDKNLLKESMASISRDLKVNVGGALHSVKQVLGAMKKENRGTLVFTGGGLALQPHPNYASLAIGKAGLLNFVRQLAVELNYTRIKVGTVVVKGFVRADDLKYNASSIADEIWKIHVQKGKSITEILY